MTGETDTEIPDTGAVFTFGNSKIANNVPSRLWLKNDIPVHISCGQSHSAFVTEQGRLFVFGSNNRGQLGLQTKGPVTKPICVKVLKGERVQFVACGTDHTLVSTSQGEFFASGGNNDGQLGLGHCNDSNSFQRLHPFCDYAPVKLLSAGGHTSAALTEDGRLFLWGDNSVGQLGLGNDSHALLPEELKLGQSIQWVSCGYRHSALVTDNGDVFTFGESADGRLGLSADQLANHSCPQRVESLHGVLQVACGGKHTLALTEDELYSFGRGEFGQLGLGTQMFVTDAPVAVGHFRKGRVTHVTCGENHSALITDSGLLYTFGDGRHGKLGLGDENFTNQFSPAVCQRFFDYSVITVACGSSHMLVFARPRQQDGEEVCLEDEDVTYSYLDRCYTSMLQGQPLEHIAEPAPALVSQLTFIPSSLPTSHRWSLSTRARRRQRESSSAQFGPEFCNLPPLTTGFTALALTGNILQPRSPTDTPKRFKTDAPVESPSTSITLPARTPPLTAITKSSENCHSVSMSDKTHEQHTNKMARASSIGKKENVPQQALPADVQAGPVSHPSMTETLPPSNLKHKKPRSGDPKNPVMQEEYFSATASQSKMQSKTYKKPIQSTNNKSRVQAVEVRSSPKRMSAKESEGCCETLSTNTDSRHKVAKADKNCKIQHTDPRGQEDSTLAEIKNISSPVQEVKEVRTEPTKVQEVKSHEIKYEGIPERATKWVKSPVKVQDVPSGRMEVSVVKSTLQTDPAQKDIKPSIGKAQEVRSTLIDVQQQGNPTSVKIPAKMQSTPKKGNEKNHVDAKENPTPKKAKKKSSDVERALMEETAPKTPSPQSDSIPTRIAKAKKREPVDAENSNIQLRTEILEKVKRDNDSKAPQNSDISFPPIENRKSGGAAEISQSTSNFQSEHKHSQSPTDKVLTEQKYDFPSIKSLTPERGHSFSNLWSNNESATSKSSATKETESSSGYLLSPSPQHRQSPINETKLKGKSVEPEEPNRKPQAEQSIMGSVVSLLPAMAIASAAPLLIKAAEVLSETSPEQSNDMSLCASVEIAGNDILPEQEVDQDGTVQDISAIEEIDDSSTKKQSAQDVQNKVVLDENGKMEEVEEVVRDRETEREEEKGEEDSLGDEEDKSEGVGQKEAVEDEERESDNNEDSDSVPKGEEDGEEEEGEEEESEAAGEEDDDRNSRQSSKSEGEKSEGDEGRDETEREEEETEGQEKEEDEDGEMEENKDEESGGEDEDEESESWDEGSEGEVEDEEKPDAEEEQEGESSNEEKMEVGEQSDSEDENKNLTSDEEEGESEEKDGSEEEENETEEEEGEQEEKGDEESQEEDEVGNEDEEENQDEETDHEEEEEGNRDQEEEEEENDEEEEVGEDKEEEVDKEDNNEELKYKKDGVTSSEEEEGEESVREKEERQSEVEAEDEENISDKDADEDKERQEGSEQIEEEDEEKEEGEKEGEMDTSEVKFREEENLSETLEENRGDEDDEVNKPIEMMEENEEDSGSEKEEEEEETDKKEENKKTDISGRKQTETNEEEEEDGGEEEEETEQKENSIESEKQKESSEEEEYEESEEEEEEEEEEAEQKEMNIKMEKNRMKQRETSEEEEQEEEEEEEEEAEQKEMNIKTEKNRRKLREAIEEEQEQEEESEEEEEEEEEAEQKEMNIKTEKNRRKPREAIEEEEEQEEESEEEEEEEPEQKEMNIKTEKNRIKQKEKSEEEEQEEEGDDEEEEETEKKDKIGRKQTETTEEEEEEEEEEQEEGEEEEGEEEEEKTKKVPKQRAKPNVLPARRQTIAQRVRQKTRQRDQQNVKGKKQTDSGAQDPQFWNSVLPQYLNLK